MKRLLLLPFIGLLLAAAPAAAQQSTDASPDGTLVAQAEPGQYVVFFPLGQAVLDAEARATVEAAAREFQTIGSTRISLRGHTDTSGNAERNQALSERRVQAVTNWLLKNGVPASAITGEGLGETDLKVPTGDGVQEAQNRRVEIAVEQPPPPPAPAPAPAPAPEPAPPVAAAPEPQLKRGLFTGGVFYGFNLEDEEGGESHLAGLNLGLDYAVLPWLSLGVEQAGFYHFATDDDGLGGRSAGSVDFLLGNEDFRPHFGGNIGYLYGEGFDDDFFAGPEIGFQIGMFNAKVAYDIPFNRQADEGIINTTLGIGIPF